MNAVVLFHLLVALVAFVAIGKFLSTGIRRESIYGLFAIRDRLIHLVADGVLSEDGEVFQYYYGRVNTIIQTAPNIGIDDILHMAFNQEQDGDAFETTLAKARKQLAILMKNEDFKKKEVCQVVENYYDALQLAILAHSNGLKTLELIGARWADTVLAPVQPFLPEIYARAKKALSHFNVSQQNIRHISRMAH